MDFTLTQEQHQLVEMVEDFARNEVAPLTREMDENQTFLPPEVWKRWLTLIFWLPMYRRNMEDWVFPLWIYS